jgi:K+-sensing histidine kinase KdpD
VRLKISGNVGVRSSPQPTNCIINKAKKVNMVVVDYGKNDKNRRLLKKLRVGTQKKQDFQIKAMPFILLLISIILLWINHLNFGQLIWFFIFGLLMFSFTTAYFLVTILEHFLPSTLVNQQFWTGEGVGGKGLAGLIYGILAIAIMLATTYLLKIMNVGYVT